MLEREYKKLVLTEFDRRWSTLKLPPELITPTRSGLKDMSIQTCTERFDFKDEPLLGSFFGTRENKAAYQIAMQNISAEEFRTLNNFLNDRKIDPSMKNINMLAWLMNFSPRPFHPNLKMPDGSIKGGRIIVDPPPPVNGYKLIVIAAALLIGICIAGYLLMNRSTGNEKCMYWKDDHYEPISCTQKPSDSSLAVIALNKNKLEHFKKITRPDTLTAASIGKVWYAKVGGEVEYYTAEGPHPVYPDRRLLPLSATILNNHYNSRMQQR